MKNTLLLSLLSLLLAAANAHIITKAMFDEVNERIEKNKNDAMALRQRAQYYIHTEEYEKAIEDLEKVRSLSPPGQFDLYLSLELATLYYKLENFDKSLFFYDLVITEDFCERYIRTPVAQTAIWTRANILFSKDEFERAWQDIVKIKEFIGSNPYVLVRSAEFAEKAGHRDEAKALYQKALLECIGIPPEDLIAKTLTSLLQSAQVAEAQEILHKLQQKIPDDPVVYFYQGLIAKHYQQDDENFAAHMEKALAQAQRIADQEQNILEGGFWQARIFLATARFKEALEAVNRAIADQESPLLFKLRATIYENLQEPQQMAADLANYKALREKFGDEDFLLMASIPLPDEKK